MEPRALEIFLAQLARGPRQGEKSGRKPVTVQGSEATIPISGVLLKTVPGWARDWGIEATGYDEIRKDIAEAMADPNVKGILVNIFGGIARCDVLAEGVVAAVKEVGLSVPLVVRLEGTMKEEGQAIIAASGLNVINANDLEDAARKIVAAVKG